MGVMIWEDFSWKRDTVLNWCERKYFEKEKRARKKQTNKHLMLRVMQCLDI